MSQLSALPAILALGAIVMLASLVGLYFAFGAWGRLVLCVLVEIALIDYLTVQLLGLSRRRG
jgi:hypothetical protein